jgi:hypothetical protein
VNAARINPRALIFALLSVAVLLCLTYAASAKADFEFEDAEVRLHHADGSFSRQAGEHADFGFFFSLPFDPAAGTPEAAHSVTLDLPSGLVGNPTAIATCDMAEFARPSGGGAHCPVASQVGIAHVFTFGANSERRKVGIYSLPHGPDVPARFGFNVLNAVTFIEPQVRPGDYGISAGSATVSQAVDVVSADVTFWGVPGDPSHNFERQEEYLGEIGGPFDGPSFIEVPFPSGAPHVGFMSSPTTCTETPVSFTARGDSWEHLGIFDTRTLTADPDGLPFRFTGCNKLPFAPTATVKPQSRLAQSPSGLDVEIDLPQSDDPDALATAALRKVRMTFPEGVTVNASSAQGRGACSQAQIGIGSNDAPMCPDASKLGTVTIDTPLLSDQLQGSVYLATQNDNPFNSLLALYIAVKGPGFWLKLPGKVEVDPSTGQMTTIFDDNPQLPFTNLHLELAGGPRAALSTPRTCGTYNVLTEFTSWASDDPVPSDSPFTISEGCAASGQFNPGLQAISGDSAAGGFSPFTLRVTRADGEPNLSRIETTLPKGLLAKLAGVPLCGEAQANSGDCPAASQVGKVTVGTGSGPTPLYVPEAGKAPTAAYLAGPYKGAPYSLVVKVPAQAGPFDLGTVSVRNGLYIDPTTAQVTAKSDPLPQILQGIPLAYRDVRVEVTRPDFTVNPTNCDAKQVTSVLTSSSGQTASPADGFKVTGCGELGFGPSLKISLKGKMKRTGNPALTATLKAPKGDANLAKTTVILPGSEFIDNAHINNPCTRVQFNAGACPASSILGTATATSPLIDQPLTGPVYFRSNGGERELPDLVADLNGPIHVTVVGFIDSVKGRVRTRFANIPDAPVSKFVLKMKGGKKGLLANSRDLCSFTPKAKVQMTGQNGKTANSSVKLGTSCGGGKRKK